MVLDTSALTAVLTDEPDAEAFALAIATAETCLLSTAPLLEAAIVIEARYGVAGGQKLDELLQAAKIRFEPVTREQIEVARLAYRTFGKGQHPAGLNFGNCFAYALAKVTGEPLLFKGSDFSETDIQIADIP